MVNYICKYASIVGMLCALFVVSCTAQNPSPPNVILIMTDDQGYGDMSCHGNPTIQTPNMDALHSESLRLTNYHVDPMCSPTRAALMTGRYASRVGVWRTYMSRHLLRRDETTMGEVFAANGYRTAMFGKWHLGDSAGYRPWERGFQETVHHGGGVVGEAPDYWGNDYYDDTYFHNGVPTQYKGYCTDIWFNEAARFIQQSGDKPFFIYLPTNAPHGPFNVPIQYKQPYLDKGVPADRASFFGMIANIDENIGKLRDKLTEWNLADNTLIIFMTDNGTGAGAGLRGSDLRVVNGFNAGMRGKKTSVYEGGHRAAGFFHWPAGGLGAGRNVDVLSAHFDLLPTLIELCNLTPPEGVQFDGTSLLPVLRDDRAVLPERTLFVHSQQRNDMPKKWDAFAAMTDRWRLVGKELYDIQVDPGQQHDIAGQHPDIVRKLTEDYEEWWDDISPRFGEYSTTTIGTPAENPVMLHCQNWIGEVVPYNQQHIRAGIEANGYWPIDVVKAGKYTVTLRRWPVELDLPIHAVVPKPELDPSIIQVNSRLHVMPSRAIIATQARLKIGDREWSRPVTAADKGITFEVNLQPGDTRLQSWLTDTDGNSWGAYYVYLEQL